MTFTVEYRNHLLRSGRWVGTFETKELAYEHAVKQGASTRSFMEYVVCEGTPKNPGKEVPGTLVKGKL